MIVAVPSLIDDVYCLATCQFITYPDGENTEASESIIDSHAPTSLENPAAARATADLDSMHAHNDKHCNHHEEARRVSLQKNIAFVWKTMVKSEDWGKLVLSVFGIIILEAPISTSERYLPAFGSLTIISNRHRGLATVATPYGTSSGIASMSFYCVLLDCYEGNLEAWQCSTNIFGDNA